MKRPTIAVLLLALALACSEEEAPAAESPPEEAREAEERDPAAALAEALGPVEPEGPEAEAVRETFEHYRRALLAEDGESAAGLVSTNTLEAYQRYRDLALTGSEDAVKELSMVERMQVLLLRHRIEPDALEMMTGRGTFAHAVDEAWVGSGGIQRLQIHRVTVRGDEANANVGMGPAPSPELFRFTKEEGEWRFDLMPSLTSAEGALQQMAAARGIEENEFLLGMIGSMSGEPATEALWQPPRE